MEKVETKQELSNETEQSKQEPAGVFADVEVGGDERTETSASGEGRKRKTIFAATSQELLHTAPENHPQFKLPLAEESNLHTPTQTGDAGSVQG